MEKCLDKGIIKIEKNKYIKILKIIPINFNLKTQLEKDVMENLKNFPLGAILVSKLYFWGLDERRLWEFCTDLNKVF